MYRPSPPTNLTQCYLKLQSPDKSSEDVPRKRDFSNDSNLVEPVHKRLVRKDFPPSRELRPLLAGHSRSPLVLHVLRNWIDNCVKNHKICNSAIAWASQNKDLLPTRLIAVDKRGQLRLVKPQRGDHAVRYRYATLTHRWGKHQIIQLSRKNKDQMEHRIRLLALPPVFRDAIRLCQSLGIPYLWIDTICIVQDDDSDRAQEISKMGYIYENAFLNIGGIAAADSVDSEHKEGLFVDRHSYAAENDPICVRIRRTDYDELSYIFKPREHVSYVNLHSASLMRRGWVLQERLLSRRSVYFASQLGWECGELKACEYLPDGDNYTNIALAPPLLWGRNAPFRMTTLASIIRRVDDKPPPRFPIRWSSNYQSWMTVVERFSWCNLTVESDCLPALSGLAKQFACMFKDEYLAGLWKNDLIRELLWHRDVGSSFDFNPRKYRAPTWSWASKTYPVRFVFNDRGDKLKTLIFTAEILESRTDLKGQDVTGEVCGGSIRLRGPMVETRRNTILWPPKNYSGSLYEWYDDGYDADGYRPAGNTYHFLIGYTRPGSNSPFEEHYNNMKVGLILKPVEGKNGSYRRVGMFTHPMPNCNIVPLLSNTILPAPGKCTEFFDFDLNNYECNTVEII